MVNGNLKRCMMNHKQEQMGKSFIIMGVSIDGDDLHPRANIIKMGEGHPLNDEDRAPWLERIRDAAFSLERKSEVGIIICSSLKKKYRDLIREGNGNVKFLFLEGTFELVLERMKQRKGHYMKTDMLKSQFETLEVPGQDEPDVIHVDISGSFEQVVERCVEALKPLI